MERYYNIGTAREWDMAIKIVYWISTVLVVALYASSATVYATQMEMAQGLIVEFGYPAYLVPLLIVVKLAAILALLVRRPVWLTQLAYAGIFYHLILAFIAHVGAGDMNFAPAIVGLLAAIISWATQNIARSPDAAYVPTWFNRWA